ncbi:MAG: ABC transporter permease [Oscillospiraceae bacterium]|nr:ABC transporter permease [Oscillospiraceae bacterium]
MKKYKLRLPKTGAIYGIVLFVILYSILLKGNYVTVNNIMNVFRQSATLCTLAICAFLAILTHQIDLSLGSIVSMSGIVLGLLLNAGTPLALAVMGAVLSGTAVGALNGVLAGYTTIPPFIITLATMNIAKSIALVINNGTLSVSDPVLKAFNDITIGIIPLPAILSLALYAFFFWLLKYRKYGTALYAVGGKEDAAMTAGIDARWIKMSVYLIGGSLAGLAGVIYSSRLSAANPTQGAGLELDAICAAVLGGTALSGGQGSIWGAYLGALAISILRNGMNLMGVRIIEQLTVIGCVLILILTFDVYNRRKGERACG